MKSVTNINDFVKSQSADENSGSSLEENNHDNPTHVPFNDVSPDTGTVTPTTPKRPLNEAIDSLVPDTCPVCNSTLSWDGVNLVCTHDKCIAKLITALEYFYSIKGMKVNGLGDKSIEKLLQISEIYKILRDNPWALLDPVTYQINTQATIVLGSKIYETIQDNVDAINGKKTMAHFISGLGFPGLGYKTTLRLCQYLKSGKLNITVSKKAQDNFIKAVPIYNEAVNEMQNFTFAALPSPAKAVYCITGVLSQSREAMIELLSSHNYEYSNIITREVNYLIVGDEPGNVKRKRATHNNIPQITEAQMMKILTGD